MSFDHRQRMAITEERWIKYYSSFHQILLVGEGDFSFSLSLAMAFGSAFNIVATSLDSYDILINKYKKAKSNVEKLKKFGAMILHGVDATNMKFHIHLQHRNFDRIIFNFPHVGFHGKEDDFRLVQMHRNLVHGFFRNASRMLQTNGEIHINHKTTRPYSLWNLEELAFGNSLTLIERVNFKIQDYAGYNNKRGDGLRCDDPFPLGECCTFKFARFPFFENPFFPQIQTRQQQNPISDFGYDCSTVFIEYFKHVAETLGTAGGRGDEWFVREALRFGLERYLREAPGRTLHDYIKMLEELHHLSRLRIERWQSMLSFDPNG